MSDHLRRERDDLHEPLVAQLAPDRPEDAGRARLALVGDEHGGVLVEPDVGAILALGLLGRADDHRPHHLALLDLAGGDGVLDRHHDDVPQPRVAALGPAEHPDHERAPRTRGTVTVFCILSLTTTPVRTLRRPLMPASSLPKWC